jgi:hypothetical protein
VVVVVVPPSTLLLLPSWRLLLRLLRQQLRWLWPPALPPSEALHDLIHQQARGHKCIGRELLLHKPAFGRTNTHSAVHHIALGCRHLSSANAAAATWDLQATHRHRQNHGVHRKLVMADLLFLRV